MRQCISRQQHKVIWKAWLLCLFLWCDQLSLKSAEKCWSWLPCSNSILWFVQHHVSYLLKYAVCKQCLKVTLYQQMTESLWHMPLPLNLYLFWRTFHGIWHWQFLCSGFISFHHIFHEVKLIAVNYILISVLNLWNTSILKHKISSRRESSVQKSRSIFIYGVLQPQLFCIQTSGSNKKKKKSVNFLWLLHKPGGKAIFFIEP